MDDDVVLDISNVNKGNEEVIPFADQLPVKYAFKACHWGQCLELLLQLCQYSDKMLLVTGVKGVGKSYLKDMFIEEVANKMHVCNLTASSGWTVNIVMRRIAQGFGLKWDEAYGSDIWLTPKGSENKNIDDNKPWILLIDDADVLNNKVLHALLTLISTENEIQKKIHIVLFGGLKLDARLSSEFFSEALFDKLHVIDIEPLTIDETRQYIMHRCKLTGKEFPNLYRESLVTKVYQLSDGVPKIINELIRKYLSGKAIHGSLFRTTKSKMPAIMMFSSLICGVFLTTFLAVKVLQPKPQDIAKADDIEKAIKKYNQVAQKHVATKEKTVLDKNATLVQNNTEKLLEKIETKVKEEKVVKKIESKEKISNQVVKQLEQDIKKKEEKKIVIATRAKPVEKKEDTKVKRVSNSKKLQGKISLELIKGISSKNYTLQLMAGNNESGIKNFLNKNKKIKDQAFYFKTTKNGKDWFVLLYGNFDSKQKALHESEILQKNVRVNPWIRNYSSLQKN